MKLEDLLNKNASTIQEQQETIEAGNRVVDDIFKSLNKPIEKIKEPGRNELCPCGSGKKYKHCCMELNNNITKKLDEYDANTL